MSNQARIKIIPAIVLLAGTLLNGAHASEAKARAAVAVSQARVTFSDLNLDTAEGASALYRRIDHAAQDVCGDERTPGSHMISPAWQRCVVQAIDRAVATVDRPALTAYHRVHSEPSNRRLPTVLASASRQ